MPNITNRNTAPGNGRRVDHRLARILDSPMLERVVPRLAPETLHRIVRHAGLDACADLVKAATPAQLTSLLDLDLWRASRSGHDDELDIERFGEWLEALVDAGDSSAAHLVSTLDVDLVVAGLSRYARVFDPGTFEPTEASDDEPMDRHGMMNAETGSKGDEIEVGGYLVRARRADAWDAIVALLVALEAEHNDTFHALMRGCRKLSNSTPEVDGLDNLLLAPEQHLHETGVERERRRTQQGYATTGDARAFIQMARHARRASEAAPTPANAIVTAYFRGLDENGESGSIVEAGAGRAVSADAASPRASVGPGDEIPMQTVAEIEELLVEAGVTTEAPRALIGAGADDPRSPNCPVLTRLMRFVWDRVPAAYDARNRELAFLANVLRAGCSIQSRPFTDNEASDAAAAVCNLGLEFWPGGGTSHDSLSRLERVGLADEFLAQHNLVAAFEVGWSVLYRDVSMFAADRLRQVLRDLDSPDADVQEGLRTLGRALAENDAAGTPWRARDAVDVLSMFDVTACVSVAGLLDECPILAATLDAIVERRRSPVDATAFTFISTAGQVEKTRQFVQLLPDLLSR